MLLIRYGFLPEGITTRKSSVGRFAPARNQRSCTIALRCPRLVAGQSFASAATHAGKLLSLKPCSAAQLPWSQADLAAAWPSARLGRFIAGRATASEREREMRVGIATPPCHSAGPRPIAINRQRPSLLATAQQLHRGATFRMHASHQCGQFLRSGSHTPWCSAAKAQ